MCSDDRLKNCCLLLVAVKNKNMVINIIFIILKLKIFKGIISFDASLVI